MTLFHLLIFSTFIFFAQCVITRTPSGDILGFTSNNIDIYLGIPYGQLSTRWSPANLPSPWNDTLNATAFGPVCHQFGPFQQPQPLLESEDCLFANIYVPKSNTSLLPVRVWLHGGGYTAGYSNDYASDNLAEFSESIIVTINYRLGIFGFFPLPNSTTHNLGWIDQQLALQWVQENIPSFGGDKTNVMLFGQSAGGGSVLAHFLMESSWPLYSSLVLQSSGPFRLADCQESEKNNLKLLEITFPECQGNLTCYQEINASRFYQELTVNWITLWPCIGEQSQLREQPITLVRKGLFNNKTNILGGFNSNEGQSVAFIFNQFNMSISSSRYRVLAEEYQIPTELVDKYDPTTTDQDYFNAFSSLFGDYFINCPNLFFFNHLAAISPSSIYVYLFIHPTENWAFSPLHFNATHLTEVPYVFNNHFGFAQLTAAETNLSVEMIDYFTSFHLSKQPWPSYKINQTIILLDIGDDKMKTQFGFDKQLIKRCSIILKYVDSDDCHGYLSEQECSTVKHCQWFGDHCDSIPTSSVPTSSISTSSIPISSVSTSSVSTSSIPTPSTPTSSALQNKYYSFLFFLFLINFLFE